MKMHILTLRGIGLLELMLVIVVLTSISLFATRFYGIARDRSRVGVAQEMINNIAAASYKWVEGHDNFSELTSIAVLIDAKLLPSDYQKNPWQGDVTVAAKMGDSTRVGISLSGVPAALCQSLVQKIAKYSDDYNNNCQNNKTFTIYFVAP